MEDQPDRCRNCHTPLQGSYCHRCGQEAREPPQRGLPLLLGLLSQGIGFEGRAPRSLFLLLTRPGRLTRAWLDGHRAPYSHPVQLYVWCTAVFFLLHAYAPVVRLDTATLSVESKLTAVVVGRHLSPATVQRLRQGRRPMEDFASRFDAVVSASLPVLLVGLVAAATLLMAVQFHREGLHTHAVFALHWSAFYFALEALRQILLRFGTVGAALAAAGFLASLAYLAVAMRVVYRRSWPGTAARAFASILAFALLLAGWLSLTTFVAERLA